MLHVIRRIYAHWLIGIMVLVGAGCGGKKAPPTGPLAMPSAATRVDHFVGSPLSGPTRDTVPAPPPSEALAVRVRMIALEKVPDAGTPLGSEARLIMATRLGTPVLPSSRLTRTARLITTRNADALQQELLERSGGRATQFFDATGAVPRGVTAVFETSGSEAFAVDVAGVEGSNRVQIFVHRSADNVPADMPQPVEIAVAIEDVAPLPEESSNEPAEEPTPTPKDTRQVAQREIALIDRQITGRETFGILVPFPLGPSSGRAMAAIVEVGAGDHSTGHLEALSSAMGQIAASAQAVAERPTTLPHGRNEMSALRTALDAVSDHRLRPSLVYLAGQTGARLCEDVSLVADESVLRVLAASAKAAVQSAGATVDPPTMGWLLDQAAFDLLGKLLSDDKLPPELAAVLSTHAGEAGRNIGSMEEVGRQLSSRQDFLNRLIAENLIYLEDSSPGARVRAFDWLNARGRAPIGFDPLAPPAERRVALEKGMAAAAAAPATTPASQPSVP